jgi:hypothetical protein
MIAIKFIFLKVDRENSGFAAAGREMVFTTTKVG